MKSSPCVDPMRYYEGRIVVSLLCLSSIEKDGRTPIYFSSTSRVLVTIPQTGSSRI